MLENIRLAFRGIRAHKMRSFLTMLGVIIGIGSIIAIVSIITGTNEQIKQNLVGAGNNCVDISLSQDGYPISLEYGEGVGSVEAPDEQLREKILSLDSVENVTFYNFRSSSQSVTVGESQVSGNKIRGVDTSYLATEGYQVTRGRNFNQKDYDERRKVILLDQAAEQSLFSNGDAVGQIVEIGSQPFTVVGILQQEETAQPQVNSLSDYLTYVTASGGLILMPNTTWEIPFSIDEPANVTVKATSVDTMQQAGKEVSALLGSLILEGSRGSISYEAEDLVEKARQLQELSGQTNTLLLVVAAISLLVGGIGVMNIMLVSVTERTNEIGLKKAIGARKKTIRAQFLTEAVVLTGLGGILGIFAGIGIAFAISVFTGTPMGFSLAAVLVSVGFSMAIGIIFGMLPSMKAANLDPIEALRHE